MIQQDLLASVQILSVNPILNEEKQIKMQYYRYLENLIKLGKWHLRQYTKAQLFFYHDILCEECDMNESSLEIIRKYIFSLIFDISAVLAFHKKTLESVKFKILVQQIISDFRLNVTDEFPLYRAIEAINGKEEAWEELLNYDQNPDHYQYYKKVHDNLMFMREKPYSILITATMSAGKSTFINALVGKNINRVQNMACTSKIHTIIGKAYEDGFISEFDLELTLNAGREELLNDNEQNSSPKIFVSTYMNGMLGGQRLLLHDSPGVNSHENEDHKIVAHKILSSKKYKSLVYVLNATQLGTTDDEQHLSEVLDLIGNIPVIFVMNKIDSLLSDEEPIEKIIERQRAFLISKGYKNPIICPVSSKAAFLAKKSLQESLSRLEQRELYTYIDSFEQKSVSGYYEEVLGFTPLVASEDETENLLKNSGFSYVEKLIYNLSAGGSKNGSDLCKV